MDNLLENKYIVSAITAYLVTSTGLLNPIIPEELLNNKSVKALVVFGIFYMANKNVTLAILLSVGYLTAIRVVDNIMEKNNLEIEGLEEPGIRIVEDVAEDVAEDVEVADATIKNGELNGELNGAEEDLANNEVQEAVVVEEPAEGETEVEEAVNEAEAVEAAGDECNCEVCKECEECEVCEECGKPKEEKESNIIGFEADNSFGTVSNMTGRNKKPKLPTPFENTDEIQGMISDYTEEGKSL
jgi:hypothetical protein